MNREHWKKLERMYIAAPCNEIYKPEVRIEDRYCEVKIEVHEKLLHAANAVHGSVYFKLLDDAAFFAANSQGEGVFVLTSNFTTYFLKPVSKGSLIAKGELLDSAGSAYLAKSVVYNEDGEVVARGSGTFVKSKIKLTEEVGYRL